MLHGSLFVVIIAKTRFTSWKATLTDLMRQTNEATGGSQTGSEIPDDEKKDRMKFEEGIADRCNPSIMQPYPAF